MTAKGNLRTGGQVLIDQLLIHRADLAFCVPGESYLAALDAMHDVRDRLRLVTCRHEAPACQMAEAYGKLTGRPGICFVTRGPGASHAMVGVHTAFQDSTPMILFIGLIAREMKEREAFQEIDLKAMFGHTTKWTAEIDDAERIPEMVMRAFQTATSGRPGPVVLGLPEDMLVDKVDAVDCAPFQPVRPSPSAADMQRFRELLAGAKSPVLLIGGGGWNAQAVADITAFAEASEIPATVSFRCQDKFDNASPCYIGDCSTSTAPALVERMKSADLVIVVGARLGEITTQGYTLFTPPVPRQKLIHIHPDAEELGRVYQAALYINAGMPEFAAAARAIKPVEAGTWRAGTKAARATFEAGQKPDHPKPGALDLAAVVEVMRRKLPADAIMANDAGNFSGWLHRYWRFTKYPSQLGPTNGAMGYGYPAALGAKLTHPDRVCIAWVGDGGFLMSGQELATAVQYGANVIAMVVNNNLYGTIRMHQEREYPGRNPATTLVNPDFAAYARAFGAHGEMVTRTEEFEPALDRALKAGKPVVMELRIDPDVITTRTTLSAMRAASLAKRQ
ncbi:thiamine pyrophosphate-binding protein [Desertibaculum subflavum]|uniref:thiamine pyrophosphate-binding protein n=1 Tax=Desertibaculum subflavum TaxID=2268458 RepID=UPI000E6616D2